MCDDDRRNNDALIPGLPDDLALKCLVIVSHGYHGVLECVAKKWKEAIRSPDYARLKASTGCCGNWLFVSIPSRNGSYEWDAYDPDANRWHPLPEVPRNVIMKRHSGHACVSVCKRLLVIGGKITCHDEHIYVTDLVISFDTFSKKWDLVASMHVGRVDFACSTIRGKVYVAGGSCSTEELNSAEVYDPFLDRWEELPPMPCSLANCFGISLGDEFHVIGGSNTFTHDIYLIFNPVKRIWKTVDQLSLFTNLTPFNAAVINDQLFSIEEDGIVKVLNWQEKEWKSLGIIPSVVLPDHSRPLQRFSYGFVGMKNFLYIIGGKVLKYDTWNHAFGIVRLNSVIFCDTRNLPLKWENCKSLIRGVHGHPLYISLEE